jgi:hypothetical protein
MLKAIIKDTLTIKTKAAIKNTGLMKKYIESMPKKITFEVEKIPLLDNEEFLVTKDEIILTPDTNGLKYGSKIYILRNKVVYSSAQAFTTAAEGNEQLVTVGQRSGLLGGFGISPFVFQLKHSKFAFFIAPVLDITNVKNIEDFYHDKPDIIINPTKEDVFARDDDIVERVNIYSKEYLLNNDPLFRKVLEME